MPHVQNLVEEGARPRAANQNNINKKGRGRGVRAKTKFGPAVRKIKDRAAPPLTKKVGPQNVGNSVSGKKRTGEGMCASGEKKPARHRNVPGPTDYTQQRGTSGMAPRDLQAKAGRKRATRTRMKYLITNQNKTTNGKQDPR